MQYRKLNAFSVLSNNSSFFFLNFFYIFRFGIISWFQDKNIEDNSSSLSLKFLIRRWVRRFCQSQISNSHLSFFKMATNNLDNETLLAIMILHILLLYSFSVCNDDVLKEYYRRLLMMMCIISFNIQYFKIDETKYISSPKNPLILFELKKFSN